VRIYGNGGPRNLRTPSLPLFALFLVVTFAMIVSACARHCTSVPPPLPDKAEAAPAAVSSKIDLHFYLDSSGSMKAFLAPARPGQPNYFTRVLNQAGDILSESWNATVSFWRFGDGEPRKISANSLGEFLSPSAFTDRSTHIEKAIQHDQHPDESAGAEKHQVKVIVTDLWQDKDGAGTLAVLLDDAYLNKENLAVGVLGVRSAFRGKADLPHSDPEAADSMPFYFLVSGQAADVRFALRHLVEDLKIADKDYFRIVFARHPVERLVHDIDVTPADNKSAYSPDDRQVPGSKGHYPVLTRVRHDLKLNMVEKDAGRLTLGPHVKLGLHPRVTAIKCCNGEVTPDPGAPEQLTVSMDTDPHQITIHRARMDADAMYRFQIDLMEDWEQPLVDLEPWNLESPQELADGRFPEEKGARPGRTLSLRHFLNVLRLKMSQHETPLARYYLYVLTN